MEPVFEAENFVENPVQVISRPGALNEVFACADKLGCRCLLIVCGRNVGQLRQVFALTQTAPDDYKVEMFNQVEPDPSDRTIAAGGQQARRCGADLIVAVGGGSSMDAGKAIAAEAVAEGVPASPPTYLMISCPLLPYPPLPEPARKLHLFR